MSSENAFKERYSCDCGYLEGKSHETTLCPYCRTNVRLVDIDLEKFAYIKIKRLLYNSSSIIFIS